MQGLTGSRPGAPRAAQMQYAMKDTIRSFIAVELDDPTRAAVAGVQDTLKRSGARVRWSQPQNIHLDVRFV